VPTSRRRHVITETDQVAAALDDAARRWPQEHGNRPRLLLRLLEEGHRAVTTQRQEFAGSRRRAIATTSGALTDAYDEDYLDRLREDWPE
jgi:hypothetical protein